MLDFCDPNRIVLMEGNAEITLGALLAKRRDLAVALASYVRASKPTEHARLDRAFRLYRNLPLARQVTILATL